jgi:predicted exporter
LQQQGQEQVTEQKLAVSELQHKMQLSEAKTQSAMQQKGEKHQQSMALADASTASGIQRANAVAAAKLKQERSTQE